MKPKWLLPISLAFLAVALIAALLIFQNQLALVPQTPSETPVPFQGEGDWVLVSINGKDVIPGAPISMTIKKDNQHQVFWLSGITDCSMYSRGVYINGYQMTPEDIPDLEGAVARISCSGPEGAVEQEKEFLDALTYATTIFVSDNSLEMHGKILNGTAVFLVFQRP